MVFFVFLLKATSAPPSTNQSHGGSVSVKSIANKRQQISDSNTVTFKDVAGIDEAKEDLEEVVQFLKHPEQFLSLGAKLPKGLLLCGRPGTGKTLLAKAVAGEAQVPFYSISASEFVELYVGVGAKKVRELFQKAKQDEKAIIFIDEIDAVAKSRTGGKAGGGNDEREQVRK